MILQAPLAFDSDLLRVMSQFFVFEFVWLSRARLVFNAEISSLKRRNHSLHDLPVGAVLP